jgi:hypothetical protein
MPLSIGHWFVFIAVLPIAGIPFWRIVRRTGIHHGAFWRREWPVKPPPLLASVRPSLVPPVVHPIHRSRAPDCRNHFRIRNRRRRP